MARTKTGETPEQQCEVTETYDQALEEGFWGVKVDPAPNEDYTVEGVIPEPPPPEGGVLSRKEPLLSKKD